MRTPKLAWLTILLVVSSMAAAPETHVDHAGLKKLGWQQAASASVFAGMTTFEMIDLLHGMGVHHIELSPGQPLSPEHRDVRIGPDMPDEHITALMAKLKDAKLDIVSYVVPSPINSSADATKLMEFGKKLKIKTLVCEKSNGTLVLESLDKLAQQFGENIAFASPQPTAAALKGLSARIGYCACPALWKQQGLDPVGIARTLKGDILCVRLIDTDAKGKTVPLTTGTADIAQVLAELKEQQFKGICTVSDDPASDAKVPENFGASINAFNDNVSKLAGTTPETK